MNINDAILAATGGPTVNDGLRAWYIAGGATSGTLQDLERQWLMIAYASSTDEMTIDELWRGFLIQSGYVVGNLQDKLRAYWTDRVTPPVPPAGQHRLTIGGSVAAYGYLDAGYGALTPNTVDGEVVLGIFVASTGVFYLQFGTGTTQLPGITRVDIISPFTGGIVVCEWVPASMDYRSVGNTGVYDFFRQNLGEYMIIDITPRP